MKIIKQGIIPENIIHRATCNRCKTEIEFRRGEGKVTHDQRDGSFVTIQCPVCGSSIHSAINTGYNGPG